MPWPRSSFIYFAPLWLVTPQYHQFDQEQLQCMQNGWNLLKPLVQRNGCRCRVTWKISMNVWYVLSWRIAFNVFSMNSCIFSAGENILHIAIVNEDPAMVKFLLDLDSDAIIKHERAYGVFFSCDDQVASRKDQPATELLKMTPNTNYKGRELTLHFSVSSWQLSSP